MRELSIEKILAEHTRSSRILHRQIPIYRTDKLKVGGEISMIKWIAIVRRNIKKTIIVYCQEGDDSSIACTILRELGYGAFDLGTYNTITLEKE